MLSWSGQGRAAQPPRRCLLSSGTRGQALPDGPCGSEQGSEVEDAPGSRAADSLRPVHAGRPVFTWLACLPSVGRTAAPRLPGFCTQRAGIAVLLMRRIGPPGSFETCRGPRTYIAVARRRPTGSSGRAAWACGRTSGVLPAARANFTGRKFFQITFCNNSKRFIRPA